MLYICCCTHIDIYIVHCLWHTYLAVILLLLCWCWAVYPTWRVLPHRLLPFPGLPTAGYAHTPAHWFGSAPLPYTPGLVRLPQVPHTHTFTAVRGCAPSTCPCSLPRLPFCTAPVFPTHYAYTHCLWFIHTRLPLHYLLHTRHTPPHVWAVEEGRKWRGERKWHVIMWLVILSWNGRKKRKHGESNMANSEMEIINNEGE